MSNKERLVEPPDPHEKDGHAVKETLQIIARRIQFAEGFSVLYGLMLLLQTGLLIWGLHFHYVNGTGQNKESGWYIALDVLVTVVLCLEVLIRMLATHQYFKSYLNWVDLIVSFLSVLFLFLYLVGAHDDLVLGLIAPTIRYLMQLVRVSIVLRNWLRRKRHMRTNDESIVDFSGLQPETLSGTVENYFDAERTELDRPSPFASFAEERTEITDI